MIHRYLRSGGIIAVLIVACARLTACTGGDLPVGSNLVSNASFENVLSGVPAEWTIKNFRGLQGMEAATWGVDDSLAADGSRSFFFEAGEETERFYLLSQEIAINGVDRVQIGGRIRSENVRRVKKQYPQANLAVAFYDKDRNRFRSARFADAKTRAIEGTTDGWQDVSYTIAVPLETRYIELICVLGMSGKIWFDDVFLLIPEPLPWEKTEDDYFTFYWLKGHPYPEGSNEFQHDLYGQYATRLGIEEKDRDKILYYFYPDSASIQEDLGIRSAMDIDYEQRVIHSIHPANDHEIIHILTEPYGNLPFAIGEGIAYYLMDNYHGKPIQPLAQELIVNGDLPTLDEMLHPTGSRLMDSSRLLPAAASFVGYLLEYGGAERFLDLHRKMGDTKNYQTFEKAFRDAYGGSLQEAETVWRRMLETADFSQQQTVDEKDDR